MVVASRFKPLQNNPMKKTMLLLMLSTALFGCQTSQNGVPANAAAPVLSGDTPRESTLIWTFNGPNPDHWRVEQLADLDNTGKKWQFCLNLPGNLRASPPNARMRPGNPVRIVGQNKKNHAVTPYSNIDSTF